MNLGIILESNLYLYLVQVIVMKSKRIRTGIGVTYKLSLFIFAVGTLVFMPFTNAYALSLIPTLLMGRWVSGIDFLLILLGAMTLGIIYFYLTADEEETAVRPTDKTSMKEPPYNLLTK